MLTGTDYIRNICKSNNIPIASLEKNCGFSNGYLNPKKLKKIPYERAVIIVDFFKKNNVIADINQILGVAPSLSQGELSTRDEKDIAKRLEAALSDLENSQDALMFSGEPLDDETRELLKASLENSIRIAKINAKQRLK